MPESWRIVSLADLPVALGYESDPDWTEEDEQTFQSLDEEYQPVRF